MDSPKARFIKGRLCLRLPVLSSRVLYGLLYLSLALGLLG